MNSIQMQFVLCFTALNFAIFLYGLWQTKFKKNAYKMTLALFPLGIFVWGDAVIIGLFWAIVSIISLILHDWLLFLIFISVFWLVRSIGETIYWFLQQFSTIERQSPKSLPGFSIFQNDSVWFAYQVVCQIITIFSLISTVYLFSLWL